MPEITITPSDYISRIGRQAREASRSMARASTAAKNAVLERIAELLLEQEADIRAANEADLEAACAEGLDEVFLDRLTISAVGLRAMAEGCRQIAALEDPVGTVTDLAFRPSGIQVGRMRVPLGVLAMIYESRPNVTIDAAALAVKSATPSSCAAAMRRFAATRSSGSLSAGPLPKKASPHAPSSSSNPPTAPWWASSSVPATTSTCLFRAAARASSPVSRPKRPFR